MALAAGTRLGPYEVVCPLGVGGMGEVYRATDTNLKRQVALKVLPASVAGDVERLARFQREAEVLAALNHPHIAQIYGLERTPDLTALVMELVDGEDLSQRIARGPILIDEALPIARQITEALEAAHESGIIHRDLKPANIKVRGDGTVKVLDFGLAKALDQETGARGQETGTLTNSSMITSPSVTHAGAILGTAAYLAPEQARGKPVDKRADIWAFGCVLYEMLTGVRAFRGATMSDTLAAVLRAEIDWARLPPNTPPPLIDLLERCLTRDVPLRLRDIGDARLELEPRRLLREAPAPSPRPSLLRWALVAVACAGVGAMLAGAAARALRPSGPAPAVVRVVVAGTSVGRTGGDHDVAISADGTQIAYVSLDGAIFIRRMDQLDATPVRGLEGARGPFFSPDGQWLGYWDTNGTLKKVATTGGSPTTICAPGATPRGATWLEDGTIVFATNDPATGLFSVPADGGTPVALTKVKPETESDHLWPHALPGARTVLFTIASAARPLEHAQTAVHDLDSGEQIILLNDASDAHYVASGHLVYTGATVGLRSVIRAVGFDRERRRVVGQPVDVVSAVAAAGQFAANFDVSAGGTLVYSTGGVVTGERTLSWLDRRGREEPINAPSRAYLYLRLSPDGRRLVLDARDQESDLWIWDFARQTLTRLTTDPTPDRFPVWFPDGRHVLFTSERDGPPNIYRQSVDATGPAERLTTAANPQMPMSVTPDGSAAVFRENAPNYDLLLLRLDDTREIAPLVKTGFLEQNGEVSPDGRWLAYEANDSGRFEIYVRPFPNVQANRWPVSSDGGSQPLWSRDGKELFYLAQTSTLMSVGVQPGTEWGATAPVQILQFPGTRRGSMVGGTGRTYDVGRDGRFVFITDPRRDPSTAVNAAPTGSSWCSIGKRS
jgi:serine/threonine-protein kinase